MACLWIFIAVVLIIQIAVIVYLVREKYMIKKALKEWMKGQIKDTNFAEITNEAIYEILEDFDVEAFADEVIAGNGDNIKNTMNAVMEAITRKLGESE